MNRMRCRILIVMIVAWITGHSAAAPPTDLRDQFGTRDLQAAVHINAAIGLSQANKPAEAKKEIDAALKADPSCQMAHFWNATIASDLGDIDLSLEAYRKTISLDPPGKSGVTATSMCNVGLLFANLGRFDESSYWFSRCIVYDEDNRFGEQAKSYRNQAINLNTQGQFLGSGLTAMLGRQIDPNKIPEKMVQEILGRAQTQEAGRVLLLENGEKPVAHAAPTSRPTATKLTKIDPTGDAIAGKVSQLLIDPLGQFAVAVEHGSNRYYFITSKDKSLKVAAMTAPGVIAAASLAGNRLFLTTGASGAPANLIGVDVKSGKTLLSFDPGAIADSLAVLPAQNAAFFSVKDEILRMDLRDGKVTSTKWPGQALVADPTEQYLYARLKDPPTSSIHTVIVDGRPIFINEGIRDWNQTTLMKYYVGAAKLIPAAMRLNAASNGHDVIVSPDAKWVCIPGGGGWRPNGGGGFAGGYVIAVFSANDFGKVIGSFSTDAYPLGAAFNPVTQQFAAIRGQDVQIYDLHNPGGKPLATLIGKFSNAAAWSADGRFLLLANEPTGLSIYANELSPSEMAHAADWHKAIVTASPKAGPASRPVDVAVAAGPTKAMIDAMARFEPAASETVVRAALNKALASGATSLPMPWRQYDPYKTSPAAGDALEGILSGNLAPGMRIYQIKKLMEKDAASVPGRFYLAEAMKDSGQGDAAQPIYLGVIHTDVGRTDLTRSALSQLAALLSSAGNTLGATHCLSQSLLLDRASPATIDQLSPLLSKLKWTEEAARLATLKTLGAPAAQPRSSELPPLDIPAKTNRVMRPSDLFAACAPSVVLIHCGNSTGTGVCVAKSGLILTSRHVIDGGDNIEVYPFIIENGKTKKLGAIKARVIVNDSDDDLAVLATDSPPDSLKPLAVAVAAPKVGQAVFTLGNPGMGRQTLDLSLSQGIISTVNREVDGHSYLQHTASVNAGNSGGPLLNEAGQVIGIVCLKARLEGVSFATPQEQIRAIFPEAVKPAPRANP